MSERQEGSFDGLWVIREVYVGEWNPLPLETNMGLAILVFSASYKAKAFVEMNWESLGPGWEPFKLREHQLAYVLRRAKDEEGVDFVVYDAPAAKIAPGVEKETLEMAQIDDFIALLEE